MKRYRLASWIMGLALILTLGAVPVLAQKKMAAFPRAMSSPERLPQRYRSQASA